MVCMTMAYLTLHFAVAPSCAYQFSNEDTIQTTGIVYRVFDPIRTTVLVPRFQRFIACTLCFYAFGVLGAEPTGVAQETRSEW